MAEWFEQKLISDGRYEIVTSIAFGLVVFRLKKSALNLDGVNSKDILGLQNDATQKVYKEMLSDGRVFLTDSKVKGKAVIRAVFGGTNVNQQTAETLFTALTECTSKVQNSN